MRVFTELRDQRPYKFRRAIPAVGHDVVIAIGVALPTLDWVGQEVISSCCGCLSSRATPGNSFIPCNAGKLFHPVQRRETRLV